MKITHILAACGLVAAAAALPATTAEAQHHGYHRGDFHHGGYRHGGYRGGWHGHRGGWGHRRCRWYWHHHHRVRRCW